MKQFKGISLKTRLYLLVLIAFVPVALLISYVAEEQKTLETDAILHKTMLLAQAAADEENQQVAAAGTLLMAVADALRVADGQASRLAGMLSDLSSQTRGYPVLGIVDADGRLLAGSDPAHMETDYAGRTWLTESLQQERLAMGQYRGERIDGIPVLYFARQVSDAGSQVTAVVFAALDLNWMNRAVFRQIAGLPEGSRLTLVDDTRAVLRYDVENTHWSVPREMAPALLQKRRRRTVRNLYRRR